MPPKKNNTWVQAIKEWQKQNPECPGIPRAGSKNYEEVMAIKADIEAGKIKVPDLAPRRKRSLCRKADEPKPMPKAEEPKKTTIKKPFRGLASASGNRSIEHKGRYFSPLELEEFKQNVKKGLVEDLPIPMKNPYAYKKPKPVKKEAKSIGLQAMPIGI